MEKSHEHHHSHIELEPGKRVKGTAVLAIIVAAVLIVVKAVAWLLTGSVALLGSFLDSVMDFSLSVMNFFAIRHALTPADEEHRFGHGKAEALAALVQGAMLSLAALFLVYEAILAILDPVAISRSDVGIGVMLFSTVLTAGLVLVQRQVAKTTQSIAISADSAHYAGDVIINIGVIAALVLSGQFGVPYADPVFGVLIALILFRSAWQIFAGAADQLMDRELDDEEREEIKKILLSHPQVRGIHDLRTRRAGLNCFIQCHIELDGRMSLSAAHTISDAAEAMVIAKFPGAEVLLHQDPEGEENLSELETS